jgi:hypothetical protein
MGKCEKPTWAHANALSMTEQTTCLEARKIPPKAGFGMTRDRMTARTTSAKPCRNAEPSANQLLSPPEKSSPTMNTHGMLGKDDSSIRHYGGADALKTLTIRSQSILFVQKRSVVPSSPQLRCSIHHRNLLFPSIDLSLVHDRSCHFL